MRSALFVLALLTLAPAVGAQERPPVYILIPSFQSSAQVERTPGTIGKRTATIFSLQVWQTLRRFPSPAPPGARPFSEAGFYLNLSAPPPKSRAEAEALARSQASETRLVLWGKAFQYGDGIVVESILSVRQDGGGRALGRDVWQVAAAAGGRQHTFSVDIPEWQYEFAPIILSPDLLPELSDPAGLKLYESPSTQSRVVGTLGRGVRALNQSGEYTYVLATSTKKRGKRGWVHLPDVSKKRSEVIDFSGGLIRIFRKDWEGAITLLGRVADSPYAPLSIKVSAYLYMGLAAEKMGERARSLAFLERAHKANPYQAAAVQYLCMSHLSALAELGRRGARGPEVAGHVEAIRRLLSANKVLFEGDDGWVVRVEKFLEEVGK